MQNLANKNKQASKGGILPFLIEFVKFTTGFAVIVAVALLTLHFTSVFF